MTQYNDFAWDEAKYPNPQQMIDNFHNKGIRVVAFYTGCLNNSAYVGSKQKCKTYDFAVENNFCVNNNRESKWFKGPAVHVDPTNPEAKKWWHTQVDVLHKMGIDGAKVDFGFAWFGDSILTSIGKLSRRQFGFQYYSDAFDYNVSRNPEFVAMTYAWSGRGLMGFPSKSHVNWLGDFNGDWKGIKAQLKNIYLSANYGFSGIGCEIGGYWNVPSNKEQFVRYTQLSSLCPVMINGGSLGAFEHHLPWKHDQETVDIYRQFVALHYELAPYLFSASVDANLKNKTIIRNGNIKEESHWLGDQLFVKAITDSIPLTTIQLPDENSWIDFWNNDKEYLPGSKFQGEYDLRHYPLFIKKGAILPLQVTNNLLGHGDSSSADKCTFLIYPNGKSSIVFHQPKGTGIAYLDIQITMNEDDRILSVSADNENKMIFLVKYPVRPTAVMNADRWSYDAVRKMLCIEKAGKSFSLKILPDK